MNKKGFADAFFWAPLTIIVYLFCWIFIFGPFLGQLGVEAVTTNGLTGLEAFIWSTMNIWAGAIPLIAYIIYIGYYGGQQ